LRRIPAIVDRALALLIGTALAVQAFVNYWGQSEPALRWDGFFYATALARTLVPAVCALVVLRIAWPRLGFGVPHVPRRDLMALSLAFVLGTGVALLLLQLESYQDAYSDVRFGDFGSRFSRWAQFTLSTTVPWEILHRGFLLHGIRELCVRGGIPSARAATLAILFTACFEVLFHFGKPPIEALGLLIGSPILSVMAFRYRSIWIPLLIHVWIELLWFLNVWL